MTGQWWAGKREFGGQAHGWEGANRGYQGMG
jgi:hypothetical protein